MVPRVLFMTRAVLTSTFNHVTYILPAFGSYITTKTETSIHPEAAGNLSLIQGLRMVTKGLGPSPVVIG